jgi:hypothetical protein
VSGALWSYFSRLSGVTGYGTRVPLEIKRRVGTGAGTGGGGSGGAGAGEAGTDGEARGPGGVAARDRVVPASAISRPHDGSGL